MKRYITLGALTLGAILLVIAIFQPVEHTATLALSGDVMLGRGVAQSNASAGWEGALSDLAPCTALADIAFANLESPLTTAPLLDNRLDLRAPPEAGLALQAGGFHVVSLANNHTSDAGLQGVQDTQQSLLAVGVQPIGPSAQPWVSQVNRLTLNWFAFDDTCRPLDLESARRALDASRLSADLIIVSIHWGSELDPAPNSRQRALAAEFAAAGADLVIGHHPHVLQPVEWVWGIERDHPTLVAYSLGNALFDQAAPPAVRYGALLLVDVGPDGVKSVCAVPTQVDPRTWRVVPASPSAIEAIKRSLGLDCILPPTCTTGLHP